VFVEAAVDALAYPMLQGLNGGAAAPAQEQDVPPLSLRGGYVDRAALWPVGSERDLGAHF